MAIGQAIHREGEIGCDRVPVGLCCVATFGETGACA